MLNWVLGQVTSVNKMFVFDLTSLCCSDSDKAFAERKEEMMSIRRRSESVLEYKEHAHGRLQEELLLAQQVRTLAERMRGHVPFVLAQECSVAVFFFLSENVTVRLLYMYIEPLWLLMISRAKFREMFDILFYKIDGTIFNV